MKSTTRFGVRTLFFSVLSLCFLFAAEAFAQPVEGCDQRVLDAMNAKAQAKVAYDTSVVEQIIRKPDSVLAMTCFNQAAGVSADKGGRIFSDPNTGFMGDDNFEPIIEDALEAMYQNYLPSAQGGVAQDTVTLGGETPPTVNYTPGQADVMSATVDCTAISDLWEKVKETGIHTDVPYVTFSEMMSGTMPANGGEEFQANWQAAYNDQNIYGTAPGALGDAVNKLPRPAAPTSFAGQNTTCDVLRAAGGNPQGC